ncbi:MAG: hypothetical protein M3Y54_06425 [Bacteroidota bacterium]|nr:hypothetical protein [Bacteroidota bacterium]
MNPSPSVWGNHRSSLLILLAAGLLAALPACQSDAARLEQLEATQQQQTRELAKLRQQLADKDDEVAQLEQCVDDLEGTVYEDPDSVATDEERAAGPVAL